MEEERWVPIDGFPDYEISDRGRVRKYLKGGLSEHGYPRISLMRNGRTLYRYIHTLVCAAFNGPRPSPRHLVAHGDGDRANSAFWNLRWATQAENMADMVRHGTSGVRGMNNPNARLTTEQVREIRRRVANGETAYAVARGLGHPNETVRKIARGGSRKYE